MHIGRIEIVLLVPGGRRQHDIGIDRSGRHAEIDTHEQVEFPFRGVLVPFDRRRFHTAGLSEVLALHAVIGSEQMLEEIFMPLAR